MNKDIIAPIISLIVMVAWAIHFVYYKPIIFARGKKAVLIWAVVSFFIASMVMQILYKIALLVFNN